MLIFRSDSLTPAVADGPASPLNAIWIGSLRRKTALPQIGHWYILFPLGDSTVQCSDMTVPKDHYLWLTQAPVDPPYSLGTLAGDRPRPDVMVFLISPAFIAEMADFLDIDPNLGDLLHQVPLLQGDTISQLLQRLSISARDKRRDEETEELFLEVTGQILNLIRLRQDALINLSGRRQSTLSDLIPRLLQARQYIEAHVFEPIKTRHVANYVGLSEFHFGRLFKSAFDVTTYQYLLRLRLDKARLLLEASELTVTTIAMRVGYDSLSAFIHAFRRRFGMSPTEYRSLPTSKKN